MPPSLLVRILVGHYYFTDISGVSKKLFCPIIMHYVTWLEEFNNLFSKETILLDLPQVQVLITLCGKLFLCEFL